MTARGGKAGQRGERETPEGKSKSQGEEQKEVWMGGREARGVSEVVGLSAWEGMGGARGRKVGMLWAERVHPRLFIYLVNSD